MVNISDICVSVWGHVGRLPGDVHTVWLRHPLLLGLSSGRLLCSVEQCGRDQEWRIQTLYDLSETIWENCGKHRNVAGMAAVHVTEQTSNSLGSQVFTLSWQLHFLANYYWMLIKWLCLFLWESIYIYRCLQWNWISNILIMDKIFMMCIRMIELHLNSFHMLPVLSTFSWTMDWLWLIVCGLWTVVGCSGADGDDSNHSELCPHRSVRTGPEDDSRSLPGNGHHYHCFVRGKYLYPMCTVMVNGFKMSAFYFSPRTGEETCL